MGFRDFFSGVEDATLLAVISTVACWLLMMLYENRVGPVSKKIITGITTLCVIFSGLVVAQISSGPRVAGAVGASIVGVLILGVFYRCGK